MMCWGLMCMDGSACKQVLQGVTTLMRVEYVMRDYGGTKRIRGCDK